MKNLKDEIKKQFPEVSKLPVQQFAHIELTEDEKKSAVYQELKRRFTYFDVELNSLTEAEINEVYRKAREKKQGEINFAEYAKKVSQGEPVAKVLTAEQLYEKLKGWMKVNTAEFDTNDGRERIYTQLCYYFANDSRFEGNLNKSILLQGGIGTGKTTIMTFFQRNQRHPFKVVRTRTVAYSYKSEGVDTIETYSANIGGTGYCFDDFGTENTLMNYGDKLNVMTEVLLNRYDDRLFPTHVTTNATLEEIKERYGDRLYDRMKEMFNQIVFPVTAKSLRK